MGETTAVAHGGDPQDRAASPVPLLPPLFPCCLPCSLAASLLLPFGNW
ncbi:hypothetical protein [Moorena sp. SIOASIH]|nr:hypothetical protein [Moorena sp. SIOASIH]